MSRDKRCYKKNKNIFSPWLTTKEALEYLRLGDRHDLRRYEKMGVLKAYRFPGKKGHKRFRREDLDKLLGYYED